MMEIHEGDEGASLNIEKLVNLEMSLIGLMKD
jgi:hypothetical protein